MSGGSGTGGLNRLILGLVALAFAIAAAVVFLLAIGLIDQERLGLFGPQVAPLVEYAGRSLSGKLALALGALVVGLTAALLAARLAMGGAGGSSRKAGQRHVLVADEKGIVVVEASGVATVAAAAARRAAGVIDVRVRVVGSGAAPVRLDVAARVSAAAELRRVGDEVRRRAAEAVQTLVGIDVSEVVVKIDVVPLEDLGRDLQ